MTYTLATFAFFILCIAALLATVVAGGQEINYRPGNPPQTCGPPEMCDPGDAEWEMGWILTWTTDILTSLAKERKT